MKKTMVVLVLTLFAGFGFIQDAKAQNASNQKTSEAVEKVDEEVNKALLESDHSAMKKLLSDDFTYIKSAGILQDRNTYLQEMKTIRYESVSSRDVKVRMYGDTAVLVGRLAAMWEGGSGRYFYTRVYIWNKDKWQLVAGQATVMN